MKLALTATPHDAKFAPILWRGPIKDAFVLAHQLGYDGVELHLRCAADVDVGTIRELQARYALEVPTLGTGMAAGEEGLTFSHPDQNVRQRAVERIKDHIRLAAQIESAVTIGLIRGWLKANPDRANSWNSILDCLGECCRFAEREGVMLFIEPVNRYETDDLNRLEQVAGVIQTIHSSHLMMLADTFHMNIEEVQMADSLRQHAAMLGHIHLVDSNRQVPGHGHLDMQAILRTLIEIGYRGYLSFEVMPLPDPRTAAADGIHTVRAMLGNTSR